MDQGLRRSSYFPGFWSADSFKTDVPKFFLSNYQKVDFFWWHTNYFLLQNIKKDIKKFQRMFEIKDRMSQSRASKVRNSFCDRWRIALIHTYIIQFVFIFFPLTCSLFQALNCVSGFCFFSDCVLCLPSAILLSSFFLRLLSFFRFWNSVEWKETDIY